MAKQKKGSKKPSSPKKAPAKKAVAKKAVAKPKKPAAKKAAPKKAAPAPQKAKKPQKPKKPQRKPVSAQEQQRRKDQRPTPPAPAAKPQQRREPSMFRRGGEARDADGTPEVKGIDRSRLGSLQAKIFRPGALAPEYRQALALMVSNLSVSVAKPRVVKQQVADELKKLARSVKAHVQDPALREGMLNDIDAFGTVVQQHR